MCMKICEICKLRAFWDRILNIIWKNSWLFFWVFVKIFCLGFEFGDSHQKVVDKHKCFEKKNNNKQDDKNDDNVFEWRIAHICWKKNLIKCHNRKNLSDKNAQRLDDVLDDLIQTLVKFYHVWNYNQKFNFVNLWEKHRTETLWDRIFFNLRKIFRTKNHEFSTKLFGFLKFW